MFGFFAVIKTTSLIKFVAVCSVESLQLKGRYEEKDTVMDLFSS